MEIIFTTSHSTEWPTLRILSHQPSRMAQSVERWVVDHKVVGLNLPAVPKVTLCSTLVVARNWDCKIGTRAWPRKIRVDSEDYYAQAKAWGRQW